MTTSSRAKEIEKGNSRRHAVLHRSEVPRESAPWTKSQSDAVCPTTKVNVPQGSGERRAEAKSTCEGGRRAEGGP